MLKKDYIQRQFEEFGRVLAMMLTLKKNSDWEKLKEEIKAATETFSSLNIDVIEKLGLEEFQNSILYQNKLTQEQQKILARLLFEKMELYLAQNNKSKADDLKEKCLTLYQYLLDNFTTNEYDLDVHYKLEILKKM